MDALCLENVSKTFGDVAAVRDLSFSIPCGGMYGLLGPNGAGKTTTIRMIMGIILPDRGHMHILGQNNPASVRQRVGYLPEERGLYRKMKVVEVLAFFAATRGLRRPEAMPRINDWLSRFDLSAWKERKVEELSKGMQQKLQFIATVLTEPELLILDEPFTGLDPVNVNLLKETILELQKKGTTVILSTHLMDQVEKLCDSICLIHRGGMVLEGPLAAIKRKHGCNSIAIAYNGTARFLHDTQLVSRFDDFGNYVEVHPANGIQPRQVLCRALEDVEIMRFEIIEPSLNEIFIHTVQG